MNPVQTWFKDHNIIIETQTFAASTHTAAQAAEQLGCDIAQIAKSILFLTPSLKPILVIAGGGQRIDEQKISNQVGEPLTKATANQVKEITGFEIGGVPPVAHKTIPTTYFDSHLLKYPTVWASAGTPHTVFSIPPSELLRLTGQLLA